MSKHFMSKEDALNVLTEYAEVINKNKNDIEKISDGEITLAVNPTPEQQAKMNIWIENE